jgi:hypothetical protein
MDRRQFTAGTIAAFAGLFHGTNGLDAFGQSGVAKTRSRQK